MRLEFPLGVWTSLMADLRRRGQGRRESGAFLLGRLATQARIVHSWISYEELDAGAMNFDFIRLGSHAFSGLWAECAARGLEVVADIHTHPLGPRQSGSDREHPMISLPGHVALIAPNFARGNVQPADLSVNIYMGDSVWQSYVAKEAAAFIKIKEGTWDGG